MIKRWLECLDKEDGCAPEDNPMAACFWGFFLGGWTVFCCIAGLLIYIYVIK